MTINPSAIPMSGPFGTPASSRFAGEQHAPGVSADNALPNDAATVSHRSASQSDRISSTPDPLTLSREAEAIRRLQMRDQEVRAHETAHAAVGGAYAGAPRYTYERGPDGRSYAVGGEVRIDVSAIPGDPEATLQKATRIRAAALAPVQPSAQDLQVARKAQAMAAEARSEIAADALLHNPSVEGTEPDRGSVVAVDDGHSIYRRGTAPAAVEHLKIYA